MQLYIHLLITANVELITETISNRIHGVNSICVPMARLDVIPRNHVQFCDEMRLGGKHLFRDRA